MSSSSNKYSVPAARRVSAAKAREIHRNRLMGFYETQDTLNEAIVVVHQLREHPDDKVTTLVRKIGCFNVYDNAEFLLQLRDWKRLGVKLLKCNIFECDFEEAGKATLFIVTPPGGSAAYCPLALALGKLCSGFGYIAREKETADLVWRYLGEHE